MNLSMIACIIQKKLVSSHMKKLTFEHVQELEHKVKKA